MEIRIWGELANQIWKEIVTEHSSVMDNHVGEIPCDFGDLEWAT